MGKTVEIYWDDLKKEKQNELLEVYLLEDCNWDVFPLCILEIGEEGKND